MAAALLLLPLIDSGLGALVELILDRSEAVQDHAREVRDSACDFDGLRLLSQEVGKHLFCTLAHLSQKLLEA